MSMTSQSVALEESELIKHKCCVSCRHSFMYKRDLLCKKYKRVDKIHGTGTYESCENQRRFPEWFLFSGRPMKDRAKFSCCEEGFGFEPKESIDIKA